MFDADKDYRGVVQDGVYSGDPDFNPIGRDDFTRTASGSYSIMGSSSDSGSNISEDVASPQMKDMTTSRSSSPSISTASRRALIAGAGGGASRRNLL